MSPHRDITRQIVRNHQRPCRCHGFTQSRQRRRNASWMALLVVLMLARHRINHLEREGDDGLAREELTIIQAAIAAAKGK